MRYASPAEAARNINELIEYVSGLEQAGQRYIYRGQLREWDGPLLPSLYRRSIRLPRTFSSTDPEYRHSLRRCGQRFVEMKPDSSLEKLAIDQPKLRMTQGEWEAVTALCDNPEFTSMIASSGLDAAVKKWIPPKQQSYVLSRLDVWATILDDLHRARIRHLAFVQPFGYMLGMTLAQQYGFSSELLDFTSNIEVAAFFATHDGPEYVFRGVPKGLGTNVGVLYRLPSTEGTVLHERIDSHNYYTSPPQLHMSDLCMRFEDKSSPEISDQWTPQLEREEMMGMVNGAVPLRFLSAMQADSEMQGGKLSPTESIDKYFELYYHPFAGNTRYYRLIDLEPGTFARSRLGRQSAVAIIPDELRITAQETGQFDYATFQAVEDVSEREGFTRFYFKQSNVTPNLDRMTREELWPVRDDCFKTMISRVLDPSTPQYSHSDTPVPKRVDLVSSGFVVHN